MEKYRRMGEEQPFVFFRTKIRIRVGALILFSLHVANGLQPLGRSNGRLV